MDSYRNDFTPYDCISDSHMPYTSLYWRPSRPVYCTAIIAVVAIRLYRGLNIDLRRLLYYDRSRRWHIRYWNKSSPTNIFIRSIICCFCSGFSWVLLVIFSGCCGSCLSYLSSIRLRGHNDPLVSINCLTRSHHTSYVLHSNSVGCSIYRVELDGLSFHRASSYGGGHHTGWCIILGVVKIISKIPESGLSELSDRGSRYYGRNGINMLSWEGCVAFRCH